MGAYLAKPVTTKHSTDAIGRFGRVGTCYMQGWRDTQEDGHTCCIDYDDNASIFGVYDGHGGHEVATYAAEELPKFIKQTDAYKRGDIKQALIDGYLKFDAHLVKPETLQKLKEISLINITEKPKDKYGVEIDEHDYYDRRTDVVTKRKRRVMEESDSDISDENNDEKDKPEQSYNSDKSLHSATNNDGASNECTGNDSEKNVESSKTANTPNISEKVVDQVPPSEAKSTEDSFTESVDDDPYNDTDDDYLKYAPKDTVSTDDDDNENDDDDDDKVQVDETADQSEIDKQPGYKSGCAAVVAILKGNDLYVANAGDSRCVLCRDGKPLSLSYDHQPDNKTERKRIKKAGGYIMDFRVNGDLNLSRTLGDHRYKKNPNFSLKKQMITSLPDIQHIVIDPKRDSFIILACDGIWEKKSRTAVVRFINKRINSEKKLSKICEKLFDMCLSKYSDCYGCDNMSAILVQFESPVSSNESN
ncbi:hypothetical protein PV328_001599 [Microctonus aethiopoides]|uniref:protein-serine/threonine phosphatase n=1 Tax=Microctonus aethiopoides TaxID=144406 RepID=A0AA39FXJ2_9HYME|nr:hypothetical protein PV328_001599 [Microctonus aethiopoides]